MTLSLSKFPFYPVPADGETIYSTLCRVAERSGLAEQHILEILTGQKRKNTYLGALPGYLEKFSSSLPEGHPWNDSSRIISQHTNLSYFTYFFSKEKQVQAKKLLLESEIAQQVSMSLGLTSYKCGSHAKHPRFCTDCLEEDSSSLGFTYFHREHQLPGVAVCWKHNKPLYHGCQNCGPYPINKQGLSMPGRCKCKNGITPLLAYNKIPEDLAPLKWLAQESAYLTSSSDAPSFDARNMLRKSAIQHGFAKGSLLQYSDLAKAIELRYTSETLKWLGLPSWENGSPSAWIRRLLPKKPYTQKKSPTILFLLYSGLFYDSIKSFELIIRETNKLETISTKSITTLKTKQTEKSRKIPNWTKSLKKSLSDHSNSLTSTSIKLQVSSYTLASEALKQKIRVPLSSQAKKRIGPDKLKNVQKSLKAGEYKKKIMNQYNISEWTLLLIELDNPALAEQHKSSVKQKCLQSHRKKIQQLMKNTPSASRTTILNDLPGTYDFMLEEDREWFEMTVPVKKINNKGKSRPNRINYSKLDREISQQIELLANNQTDINIKPIRLTRTGLLKEVRQLQRFTNIKDKLPLTNEALDKYAESKPEFLDRKIRWAISQLSKEGQSISVNRLRRKVGVPAQQVRDKKLFVQNIAEGFSAKIPSNSFFYTP